MRLLRLKWLGGSKRELALEKCKKKGRVVLLGLFYAVLVVCVHLRWVVGVVVLEIAIVALVVSEDL